MFYTFFLSPNSTTNSVQWIKALRGVEHGVTQTTLVSEKSKNWRGLQSVGVDCVLRWAICNVVTVTSNKIFP